MRSPCAPFTSPSAGPDRHSDPQHRAGASRTGAETKLSRRGASTILSTREQATLELRPSSTGAGRKKSDHGSAPFPPVPSGCNSREWQRGNDAVHPLPPWWGVVGDATTTTARTDHSLPPWWRVAHPVHLLPCCCPAHLTRAEARMAPPMIIGMKSRSPHLDGCGSVERRSPRNTRVDPTRMGVAAVLTMKSEEPEAHPTRMGVAETFQTLSA